MFKVCWDTTTVKHYSGRMNMCCHMPAQGPAYTCQLYGGNINSTTCLHTVAVKTGRMFSYFAYTRCELLHSLVYSNVVYTIRKSKLWVTLWYYKYCSRASVSVITGPQSPTVHATSFDGVYK